MNERHHQIVIVGGGNAGISTAARLLRARRDLDVAIIDPARDHYYQPAWTLVGGGVFDVEKTRRPEADVMPDGVEWIQAPVSGFEPEENRVRLGDGGAVRYDALVVCPGIQLNWSAIDGLPATLGANGVCSNYLYEQAPYTWECLQHFDGGRALFTQPNTPVKCGGAPQKIMYLAADHWSRRGILDRSKIDFMTPGKVLFGVDKYAHTLHQVCDRYGIDIHYRHNLVAIDGPRQEATFEVTDPDTGEVTRVVEGFEMIHVVPPQSAPDCVRESPLADANGWLDVDRRTLQHVRYGNVFGLGDVTNTPNAKTGAAVRKQAPVVVANLLATLVSAEPGATYSGYGSCPLITGYGKLVLAEFDYDNQPMETFPFDQSKERWSMYQLKRRVLPWLYWNKILKGTA